MIAHSNKSYRVTCSYSGPVHSSAKGRVWVSYLCYRTREWYCVVLFTPPRNNTQSGLDYNYRVEETIELYFGHLTS